MQHNEDSRVIALTQIIGTAPASAVNLTGIESITMILTNANETVIDSLEIGDGIEIVSAAGGTIRVTFSPARTANCGTYNWRLVLVWTNGTGPLTWPLSGSAPRLIINRSPAVGTLTASRIYYGVGVAGLTSVSTLQYDDLHSSLYFTTPPLDPSNQKAYVAYPSLWGAAQLYVDGLNQTAAFTRSTILVGVVSYYLYESTQLLTTLDLEIEARA